MIPDGKTIDSIEAFTLSFDDWGIPHTDTSATDEANSSGHPMRRSQYLPAESSEIITITPNTGFIP